MINKAVFSFFSYPLLKGTDYANFRTLEDFLSAWTLSVNLACQQFKEIELVTDNFGKKILVDKLGLPFTKVINEIDEKIPDHVKDIYWAFSKLWAYFLQKEPFIHIDYDVFLWKRLPDSILEAPLFGQNTESDIWKIDLYRLGYRMMCRHLKYKPEDWTVVHPYIHKNNIAINAGILGGNDIEFLSKYASTAVKIITSEDNKEGFEIIKRLDKLIDGKIAGGCNVITEQYLYSSLCYSTGKWNNLKFLIDEQEAFTENDPHIIINEICRKIGYTHLIGYHKKNPSVMDRLRTRIQQEYPLYYERIKALKESLDSGQPTTSGSADSSFFTVLR